MTSNSPCSFGLLTLCPARELENWACHGLSTWWGTRPCQVMRIPCCGPGHPGAHAHCPRCEAVELQHPLHGPVHVAVPVEGQEAHGAVLLQRRVARGCPASSAHAWGRCATRRTWQMPRRFQSWRSMASKSAHLLHAQLQQLGRAAGRLLRPLMRWRRSVPPRSWRCVLWVLTTQCPSGQGNRSRPRAAGCLVAPPSSFTRSQSLRSQPVPAFRPR